MAPALRVRQLTKTFHVGRRGAPGLVALDGVSLDIADGESLALVGESGSGKSTLLRAVAGLLTPDDGEIDCPGGRPQMVFQDAGASLTPWLSVGELVGARLRAAGARRAQRSRAVADVLRLVGLSEEIVAAKPMQLSGGQRQRVAIARAVVVPPKLLLCDEPTSALDVSIAATTLNLLGRLRREFGMAMLFVTHDLAVARLIADRIAVMFAGRVVEDADADVLVTSALHPYSRELIASVPDRHSGPTAAPVRLDAADDRRGCAYRSRCPEAIAECTTTVPELVDHTARHVACLRREPAERIAISTGEEHT